MLPLTMKSKCRCFKCFNQSHSEIPSRDRSLNGMETGKRNIIKTATYDVLMKNDLFIFCYANISPNT